jgi:hypothetical protein
VAFLRALQISRPPGGGRGTGAAENCLSSSENIQLTVPENTELQIKTQTGLIYVEQVLGDMKLESVAGDVHLKEVSGYIIVRTTGGSLVCTQCAGKLDFNSISGNAQILKPSLKNVTLVTMTGNILFDGDFIRTGIYSMKSGRGLRLLLEAAQTLPVAYKFIAHHLDGNIANQPTVPGPVNLTHATGADGLEDLIGRIKFILGMLHEM